MAVRKCQQIRRALLPNVAAQRQMLRLYGFTICASTVSRTRLGITLNDLRGRGRPRLSEEERQERQQRYLDARVRDREDDRIRGLPVSQRRLAESARGTRQITDFFKKRRVEGVHKEQ